MGLFSGYVAWTERLIENRTLLTLFVYTNIAGAVLGVLVYGRAMEETPPYLWLLLLDCPIYPALMVFILTFRGSKLAQKLSFLAFYGLIKYGLWTITAWSLHYQQFLAYNTLVNSLIFIGHFGMVLEAGFVARMASKAEGLWVILPVAWMFTNDFFDYFVGTHPPLPESSYLGLLLAQNIVLDFAIPLLLFYVIKREFE